MAFGGEPFWQRPGNRRDSNKCRFRSARPSSAPATGLLLGASLPAFAGIYLLSLSSLSTAAIGELQIKVPAGITVPFGITTTPSRMQ